MSFGQYLVSSQGVRTKEGRLTMDEYIKREAAIDLITRRYENPEICTQEINSIPAADVAPVVHGRWIKKWDLYDKGFYISRKEWYTCSNCGMKTNYKDESFEKEVGYNYCPNCGAKMDGGDGDAAD